jgi:hypothetical protein
MPCKSEKRKGGPVDGVALANGKGGYIRFKHKGNSINKWRSKAAKQRKG